MRYYGTITGLPTTGLPTAVPVKPPEKERSAPNYLGLGFLCLVGVVICVGLAVLVGRSAKGGR